MLDLKFVRDNPDVIRENIRRRNVAADVDRVIDLYDRRLEAIKSVETLRAERNENARSMKQKLSDEERSRYVEEGKRIKSDIASKEEELRTVEGALKEAAEALPNLTHPDSPVGTDEAANRELEVVGTVPEFSFAPRDHVDLGQALDLVDFQHAADVSGAKLIRASISSWLWSASPSTSLPSAALPP